jgi:hypothetical protein
LRGFVGELLEAIEVLGPEDTVVIEPGEKRREAFVPGAVVYVTAFAAAMDESGAAEDGEMLGDGGLGDGKALNEE